MRLIIALCCAVEAFGLVPCSVKECATGIRDGLQKALRARQSRLSVELPPGAPLTLQGEDDFGWFRKPETETAKVVVGDRALADFAALLFPEDMKVAAVYADGAAAAAAAGSKRTAARCAVYALPGDGAAVALTKKKKKGRKSRAAAGRPAAAGFGAGPSAPPPPPAAWCPALGVRDACEVILVVGALDEDASRTVADARVAEDDRHVVAERAGNAAAGFDAFRPAFALSPPPGDAAGDLVAAYEFPGPWVVGEPRLLGGARELWRGDDRPTAQDAANALDAAADDDPFAAAKSLFSR